MVLFLTLEGVLFLTLERPKRGTKTNSPAYIYIYIYGPRPICSHKFAQKWPFFPSYIAKMAPKKGQDFVHRFDLLCLSNPFVPVRNPLFPTGWEQFLSKIVATDQSRGIYIYIYMSVSVSVSVSLCVCVSACACLGAHVRVCACMSACVRVCVCV